MLAQEAFGTCRRTDPKTRAAFLESIAANIEALAETLSDRVQAETGLPAARVAGETGRTAGQLRMFAQVVRDGGYREVRIETALPDRKPLPGRSCGSGRSRSGRWRSSVPQFSARLLGRRR